MTKPSIKKASKEDLIALLPLITKYREFYHSPHKEQKELLDFFEKNLSHEQAIIYIAFSESTPIAFTQVYKTYSTVGLGNIWILNDLFVAPEKRRTGVAKHLIKTVLKEASKENILRVDLKTARGNAIAKNLYKGLGFSEDLLFDYFHHKLD